MLLNDREIKELIDKKEIIIEPFSYEQIQPASIDLRLGNRFRIFRKGEIEVIDPKDFKDELIKIEQDENKIIEKYKYTDVIITENPFIIYPGDFVLASIYEYIKLPRYIAAQLHGKSSIARLGLIIHTSAGWIDPGYEGHLTLEIFNTNNVPIKLYPKMKIAQLQLFRINPVERDYKEKGGKYYKEKGATSSEIWKDFI
ncbi:NEQ316 [Nanoarchaeum equitans Kin4-M]|uniref:dCTP deaminase, dUMP-forming n=1 Tax=Nanoarchaeum equitans (strain Kin4-M) TaxID=228908 RepID=DCDB_NANEQ|nr:RecName: Full=dCTP deaminase, dUMP-forming; AltName: Full=Bifunctional dCTP deaminase:dUTPase; AltName: Full=DCD-DUT [Nanoarchaeum equitans Kin4-M]AAR39163.1 NEQ316 [Nanoarchaeum equitans Kin4-M]